MQKTKPIRDPVHNYIELTPIEQVIIDRPEFQRLRFVIQNSTAYLTYPGNTHGRFLHSLGVMHIAGEMFCRSLQNSSGDILNGYLEASKSKVEEHARKIEEEYEQILKGWKTSLGDEARFNHRPLRGERAEISVEQLFLINTLWQVVRVAALVHDLGHLPMSHVFEFAVEELLNELAPEAPFVADYSKRKVSFLNEIRTDVGEEIADAVEDFATHEILGVSIFRKIYPIGHEKPSVNAFQKLVSSMVKMVLLYPEPDQSGEESAPFSGDEAGILRGLHGVVAGELDADRLDYCLRDPLKSGLELGAFDLRRIINSFVMHKEGTCFVLLPTTKALSAIESFYHQRFLLYRYLYYHHNVIRMDGILKEILIRLLKKVTETTEDSLGLRRKLIDLGLWQETPDEQDYHFMSKARFAHLDDAWLRTMLAEMYHILKQADSGDLERDDSNLLLLIDTFLHRKSDNVISMWKQDAEYFRDFDKIVEKLELEEEKRDDIKEKLGKLSGLEFDALVPTIEKNLPEDVLLVYRYLSPKTSKKLLVLVGDHPVDLNKLSPYCESLRAVAEKTCLFHFSFVGVGLKQNTSTQTECRKAVLCGLRNYISKLSSNT